MLDVPLQIKPIAPAELTFYNVVTLFTQNTNCPNVTATGQQQLQVIGHVGESTGTSMELQMKVYRQ